MSKAIKVTDKVYALIQKYQAPRESYSSVLERVFAGWEVLDRIKRGEYPPFTDPERQ